MIDIKELRRLAQAAIAKMNASDPEFASSTPPLAILELLDRLEAAEKSRDELLACLGEWLDKTKWVQQGVNEGTISEKYLGLHRADVMSSLLGEAEKERDDLKAKIAEMERQEPVMWANSSNINSSRINRERGGCGDQHTCSETQTTYHDTQLYALPGAQTQPAPGIPEGWKLVPIKPTVEIRKAMHYAYWQSQSPQMPYHDGSPELWNAAYAAMLTAAPEAKP